MSECKRCGLSLAVGRGEGCTRGTRSGEGWEYPFRLSESGTVNGGTPRKLLLLRRPIVSGCAQGTARINDLGIRLELQAQPGSCVGGCSSAQGGGETDGLPRLVDALCEVGDGQCRDILCLVQRVGVRHGAGPVQEIVWEWKIGGGCPRAPWEGIGCILSMIYWTLCGDVLHMGCAGLVCWRCICGGLLAHCMS
jgi:hypothetical protein